MTPNDFVHVYFAVGAHQSLTVCTPNVAPAFTILSSKVISGRPDRCAMARCKASGMRRPRSNCRTNTAACATSMLSISIACVSPARQSVEVGEPVLSDLRGHCAYSNQARERAGDFTRSKIADGGPLAQTLHQSVYHCAFGFVD